MYMLRGIPANVTCHQESCLVLVGNQALRCELEKRSAEVENAQTHIKSLERKLQKSEAEIRNLKAKFGQTDVSHLIAAVKQMENGDIARLQAEVSSLTDSLDSANIEIANVKHALKNKNTELENERELRLGIEEQLGKKNAEAAKLSAENEMKKQELSGLQKRFAESEKRIAHMNKEKAEMVETELKRWDSLHLQLVKVQSIIKDADEMRKMKEESKNKQKRQSQDSGLDHDLAKRACIEKNAKEAPNVASGSKASIIP
ncbi:hypothetical protein Ddc_14017 [Ditylenchus destructor]|nr:hypothetical protein Ddc_14017 [Ditylenchus destructor]